MFRGQGRGRGGKAYNSPSKSAPKGLFADGTWHCDCDPRMPAEHFQTKNGGPNHGRWFYTCQKPQPKRCNFFLWDDAAKQREKAVVLNNVRSEVDRARPTSNPTPGDPLDMPKPSREIITTPSRRSTAESSDKTLDHEDSFGWPSSEDDVFVNAEGALNSAPVTPRKASKTVQFASPGKRGHAEMETASESTASWPTPSSSDDVFETPYTPKTGRHGLLSPEVTPAIDRIKDGDASSTDLVSEVMGLLSSAHLEPEVHTKLVEVLSKHELRTQGIARGRDITRVAIRTKDKHISELQARITALEAEKETSKLVIAHLKHDISTPRTKKG